MGTETEEGPLLALTFSLTEQEAKALAAFLARAARGAARGAEGDREALRLERALAPAPRGAGEGGLHGAVRGRAPGRRSASPPCGGDAAGIARGRRLPLVPARPSRALVLDQMSA